MPISVVCPGCKTRFRVSDRFAGQKGPCPKCKTIITVPKPTRVIIHEPEDTRLNRDSRGRVIARPIFRYQSALSAQILWITLGVTLVVLLGAWLLGPVFQANFVLLVGAVLVLAVPLCWLGYQLLFDREVEPHQGRALMVRTLVCALGYTAMVAALHFVPPGVLSEPWKWLYIGPLLVSIGTLVAVGSYDLDFPQAFLHFTFFALSMMLLRWLAGMPPLWAPGEEVAWAGWTLWGKLLGV